MGRKSHCSIEQQKQEIMQRYKAASEGERRIEAEANAKIQYFRDLRESLYRQYKTLERK